MLPYDVTITTVYAGSMIKPKHRVLNLIIDYLPL